MIKSFKKSNQSWSAPKLSLIATALFAMSNTVIAQEGIEEIIVTGEKIERSLQDTVSSVAVFTATDIEESAIYDIQEVFDRLANVSSAEGGTGFTIRGINDRSISGAGTSGLASFHLDGAFISRRGVQAGQTELWDIGQVEVFRGPQSTNQGRNSLAGAIFIRGNEPTYEPEGQYRIAYGTDNTRALSFAYGEALIEDQLAFRIAIDDQATDGFITNDLLDDDEYGDSSNTTVRAKLLIEPKAIPGLSVLTTLSYSENEAGDTFSSLIDADGNEIDPFDNRVFANIEAFDNVDQTIATTEVNYEINDQWSLTSITSYNDTDFFRQDDDDRQASGGIAVNVREETTETFSQELRLNFQTDKLTGNVGFYYFESDNEETIDDFRSTENVQTTIQNTVLSFGQPIQVASLIASLYEDDVLVDRSGGSTQDIENYALFANVEYKANDFLTLFAGFRYDSEDVDNVENVTNLLLTELPDPIAIGQTFGPAAAGGVTLVNNIINGLAEDGTNLNNNASFNAFLPKAGITLNWSDDLSTSFTVQRAYRAGGAGTTTTPAELGGTGNFQIDPEFTTNYDFSLRSQWFDNRLTVNANLFYIDWEDQQVSIIDPLSVDGNNNDRIVENTGESSLKGAELEVSFRPNNSLELYTSYGYVDTEFDEFPETDGEGDLTGNEFNDAPKETASAGFNYDVTNALRIQADVNYQAESFDDAENQSENDSRTLFNSKITYRYSEALEFSLVGRNIFDKEYLVRNDEFNDDVVIVGQPRTVLFQLQGKF